MPKETRSAPRPRLAAYQRRGFDCLCGNTRMAARALTTIYDEYLAPAGVSSSQLAVLWCVVGAQPVSMSEAAALLVMDKTTVSRNVSALLEMGLVAVKSGTDARVRLLTSTARGRAVFERAMPLWESAQAYVAERVGSTRFMEAVLQTRRLARAVAPNPPAARGSRA
jgi:DNA-binding MarR family transcriptional regulator